MLMIESPAAKRVIQIWCILNRVSIVHMSYFEFAVAVDLHYDESKNGYAIGMLMCTAVPLGLLGKN